MDGRRLAWLLAKAKLHLITSPSSSSRLKKSESRGGVNSASLIDADGRQPDRDRGRPLVSQKKREKQYPMGIEMPSRQNRILFNGGFFSSSSTPASRRRRKWKNWDEICL
jgi:hypothetical protein